MSKARELSQRAGVDGALSNRNWLINGDFSVWQRGLFHITAGYGSVDRWSQHFNGTQILSRHDMTQTRANEIKAACGHVPNYFVSYVVQSFGTYSGFRTRIEDIMKASGQTVTFSVVAASENGSILTPAIRIYNTSAGVSQERFLTSVTTNSVMNRYEFTVTLSDVFTVGATPDGTGWIEVELYTDRVGWHDYACFQLEVGDTATPFEHRLNELSLCERFLQTLPVGGGAYAALPGYDGSIALVHLRQTMRASPTLLPTGITGYGGGNTEYRVYLMSSGGGGFAGSPVAVNFFPDYVTPTKIRLIASHASGWYNATWEVTGSFIDVGAGCKILLEAEL